MHRRQTFQGLLQGCLWGSVWPILTLEFATDTSDRDSIIPYFRSQVFNLQNMSLFYYSIVHKSRWCCPEANSNSWELVLGQTILVECTKKKYDYCTIIALHVNSRPDGVTLQANDTDLICKGTFSAWQSQSCWTMSFCQLCQSDLGRPVESSWLTLTAKDYICSAPSNEGFFLRNKVFTMSLLLAVHEIRHITLHWTLPIFLASPVSQFPILLPLSPETWR